MATVSWRETTSINYLPHLRQVVGSTSTVTRFVQSIGVGSQGAQEPLGATGRPLGLFSGGVYEEAAIRLAPDDRVFFYTDGVVEAENTLGEPFGVDRLGQALGMAAGVGASQVLDNVSGEVSRHRGEVEPGDDVTLMVAAYHGTPA
jgi:serine phosphatase RsbU (regulator of sigma subunit)